MESDERFKDLVKDPRFKALKKRKTEVKIDDRFKSMFDDEKFILKSRDKRGHDEESEESSSSSSDEDDDSEVDELEPERIQYDWKPLDADAETCEVATRRLAIQNLDWDHLDVRDIFTLLNSIRPPKSVKIYVSDFGKSRLKDEELEGPKEFKELGQVDSVEEEYELLKEKMKLLEKPHLETYKVNEYDDADEAMNLKDEKIRELVRTYQLNRMRYYYAVAEFDSANSAELVYKELDGMEYEGSSMELDLRFIPDDVEFDDEDMKAECNKLPDLTTYKVPQFINSALQQTTVKFTWDETDSKRQEKLRRAYTKEELEKDDLDAYLATDSESGDDEDEDENGHDERAADAVSVVTANSEARANKYKMLLQTLEEEQQAKKKVDVDVEWGDFSGDDEKEDDAEQASEVGSEVDSEESEESVESEPEKRRKRNKRKRSEKKVADGDDGELDLLVMDTAESRVGEFRFDPNDSRFQAIYDSGLYNIDPSHPNFKRTEAFDKIAENKRARRQR